MQEKQATIVGVRPKQSPRVKERPSRNDVAFKCRYKGVDLTFYTSCDQELMTDILELVVLDDR